MAALFKSYYVVWKQSTIWFALARYMGLNRTMQYGNIAWKK